MRQCPPTTATTVVATSGYGRLLTAAAVAVAAAGAARRGAACDGRVARGAAGDESASPLARIIGIKRPICRPMIASRSAT